MRRIALTDGSGRWFDLDSAEKFDEATFWDGRNRISLATGSQWDHETLYRTKSGHWVRHWWTQWEGAADQWTLISADEAARWLVRNGYDPAEYGLGQLVAQLEL